MSESTTKAAEPAAPRRSLKFGFLLNLTLLGLLILMWLVLSVATDSFATYANFSNLMRQASLWAIIAIGQTFVIITAGIDLSVGAVVGLASTVVALLMRDGWPIPLAIAVTLLMGIAIGAFHGFAIVRMRLPPFITTLASLTALRGIGLMMTNGQTIAGLPASFGAFSRESFLGIPNLFWMVIVVAVPAYLVLHNSRWGRYLYAVGSNPEAARLSGVNIGGPSISPTWSRPGSRPSRACSPPRASASASPPPATAGSCNRSPRR